MFQATPSFLNSLQGEAARLETFLLAPTHINYGHADSDGPLVRPFDNWKMPRLRTLAVAWFVGWHVATFPSLAHFILERCNIDSSILRGLHALLTTSPYLEDLVFSNVSARDDEETSAIVDTLSPVNLPRLQRIVLSDAAIVAQLVQKKVTPNDESAKDISQGPRLTAFTEFSHGTLPVAKLCFDHLHVVGTDGRSSFRASGVQWEELVAFYERIIRRPQDHPVREVHFLGKPRHLTGDMNPNASRAFRSMQGVTKVVVVSLRNKDYLTNLSLHRLFPHLAELELQNIPAHREEALMGILQRRTTPLETLRFVHYGKTTDTLAHWRGLALLLRHFADNVVFENYDDPSCAPRMGLPDICTTASTVHGYWLPWEMAC